MDKDKQKEKETKEAVENAVKIMVAESTKEITAEVKVIKEENKGLKEQVEILKAAPVKESPIKGDGITVGDPDIYKGKIFRKQFSGSPEYLVGKSDKEKSAVIKAGLDLVDAGVNGATEKTMTQGGAGTGLEFTPQNVYLDTIEVMARESSVCLPGCRTFPMANNQILVPKAGSSITGEWTNEATAPTESEPGTANMTLTAKRYRMLGQISEDLLSDANVDLLGYLADDIKEHYGQTIDGQVFNGTEFSAIFDIARTTSNKVRVGATNTGTSYADMVAQNFYDLRAKLSKVRRGGAAWYMAREAAAVVAGLDTGTGGVPLVNYLGAQQSTMIAGYPMEEVEVINGDSTSADFCTYCNLKNYALGSRLEPVLEFDKSPGFTKGTVYFRAFARVIGAPLHSAMFTFLDIS